MALKTSLQVRPADVSDQQQIASLIHFEPYVHRHLDWRSPLDWLGIPPFYVLEKDHSLVGALAGQPDPPRIAWIRLFTCAEQIPLEEGWSVLWEAVRSDLSNQGKFIVAGITLQSWTRSLLKSSGFTSVQEIIMLESDNGRKEVDAAPGKMLLRSMVPADMENVARLDALAFAPLWHNSLNSLKQAYTQSAVATVAENEEGIIGYQISTQNPGGGHLARLAVRPDAQGQGVGVALVTDVIQRFNQRGVFRLTVNTQSDNAISLTLYRRLGFHQTGEHYPVYTCQI